MSNMKHWLLASSTTFSRRQQGRSGHHATHGMGVKAVAPIRSVPLRLCLELAAGFECRQQGSFRSRLPYSSRFYRVQIQSCLGGRSSAKQHMVISIPCVCRLGWSVFAHRRLDEAGCGSLAGCYHLEIPDRHESNLSLLSCCQPRAHFTLACFVKGCYH